MSLNNFRILAIDQARDGGWSVFDYGSKALISYGTFNFDSSKFEFEKFIVELIKLVQTIVETCDVSAIFIEDIQMQKNVSSFKKLAQLQGALIYKFATEEYLYDIVPPLRWQNYCNARGRRSNEVKKKITTLDISGKKTSKILSLEFVRDNYGVETDNDNLADAICIGHWVVNNITIKGVKDEQKEPEGIC